MGRETSEMERQRLLGARLRSIRHQQGLSLADVEGKSGGEWKAVVVGAYERGDRSITIARLQRLAGFYGVPLDDLLSPPPATDGNESDPRITLDLLRLSVTPGDGVAAVSRFAERVTRVRGDHNGRVLTLRSADVRTIALAVGEEPEDLVITLRDHGILLDRGATPSG